MNTSCLLSSSWDAKENKGVLVHNVIPLPQHAYSLPFFPKTHLKPYHPCFLGELNQAPLPRVPERGPDAPSKGRRPIGCGVGGEGFFQGWELAAGGAAQEGAADSSAGTGPVAMAVLGIGALAGYGFPCLLPASPVAHTAQRREKSCLPVNGCLLPPRQGPRVSPGRVLQVESWGGLLGGLFPGHQGTLGFQSEGEVSWLS